MKILYLTDAQPDYLSDDLLYGLRSLLGSDVVDYPRKDVLYRTSSLKPAAAQLYGRGFHCFGDFIINSSAWRIRCPFHPRLVVLDGEDHGRLMPRYAGKPALYFGTGPQHGEAASGGDISPAVFVPDVAGVRRRYQTVMVRHLAERRRV